MKQRFSILAISFLMFTKFSAAQIDPRIGQFLDAKRHLTYGASFKYLDQLFPEWRLSKMNNICGCVGSRTKDINPSQLFDYMYVRKFYEAARIDTAKDDEATVVRKIGNMWNIFLQTNMYVCNNTQFDVVDGSVLKYAVTTFFEEFINDIIKWKLSLNRIDDFDKRTLLDYVQYQIDNNKNNALESKFRHYYNKLRAAGAKHKWEL